MSELKKVTQVFIIRYFICIFVVDMAIFILKLTMSSKQLKVDESITVTCFDCFSRTYCPENLGRMALAC